MDHPIFDPNEPENEISLLPPPPTLFFFPIPCLEKYLFSVLKHLRLTESDLWCIE